MLDQVDFPVAPIALERLLALNCFRHIYIFLEMDKDPHTISARETSPVSISMGLDTAEKIVRYAGVERAVGFACEDEDEVAVHHA